MARFGGSSRAKRPAPARSSAVNRSYRGGATPAVRDYLGDLQNAEIRASRGVGSRRPATAARTESRSRKSPSARQRSDRAAARAESRAAARAEGRDRVEDTRRQSLRALDQNIVRSQSARTRRATAGATGRSAQAPSRRSAPAVAARAPQGPSGRTVVAAGGAAALTVGKAMAEVARPAAAAAKPMLRVVSGGLEKLPAGPGAQAAARGRILIVIAGLLAAGLIYINVGKLEAGDGYGRYAQRSLELQRENTIIRSKVAALESSERIARRAKKLGMVMPQPEQFKYLRTRQGDSVRAIRTYTAPAPAPPPAQPQTQTTPAPAAPDTGAAAPQQTAPQPVTPQAPAQQPVAPGAAAPGAQPAPTPGAGTGAPAAGGN